MEIKRNNFIYAIWYKKKCEQGFDSIDFLCYGWVLFMAHVIIDVICYYIVFGVLLLL